MVNNHTKRKRPMRGMALLASAALLLSGCGAGETAQESQEPEDIEILYHADDGEFNRKWGEMESISPEEGSSASESETEPEEKTVITLATVVMPTGENETNLIEDVVAEFNRRNTKYSVELRTCYSGEELGTMRERLSVEVGAGGGPDILTGDVFPITQEIMDSGVLVDLSPYLEKSGVTPETFFPEYAYAVSGDRIYGIVPEMSIRGYCVDAAVLGDSQPPQDIESFADLLLEYPGHGSFLGPMTGGRYILAYFLEGSEDLWGMIDWEKKTCDFTGPLFSKFLDVSKRYREDGKKGYDSVVNDYFVHIQGPPSYQISSQFPGNVIVGYFFDDGPHYNASAAASDVMMINANTEHLEGAYAFLSFVLSRDGQDFYGESVQKELWNTSWEYSAKLSEVGAIDAPLNEETKQEMLDAYEDARFLPRRTEAILDIVYEEAEDYLEGDRSKEDVIEKIQNRVQLYLDEQG